MRASLLRVDGLKGLFEMVLLRTDEMLGAFIRCGLWGVQDYR